MMIVALLALDIPFCFLDSAHANYSGTRMAAIQYEKSVAIRRHAIRLLLNWLTRWRLGLAILDGDLRLPAKMAPSSLLWEWMHSGTPWYDPQKEVTGAVAEVNAGFNSPQRICRDRGLNFKRIIDERAEAEAYARKKGVILSTALAATALDDPAKQQAITETQNEDQETKDAKAASTARWSF
jgi:capsid protein